jgi:hypothetical protein
MSAFAPLFGASEHQLPLGAALNQGLIGNCVIGQAFSFFGKCLIFGGFFRFHGPKKHWTTSPRNFAPPKWPSSTTPPKQRTVQGKAGAYAGTKKYGEPTNLPASAMKKKGVSLALKASRSAAPSSTSKVHKPT